MSTSEDAVPACEAAGSPMARRFSDVSSVMLNCAGAGAAAPPPEDADPAEPAANVGAVDGALKPPSDDAMAVRVRTRENPPSRHQPGYG